MGKCLDEIHKENRLQGNWLGSVEGSEWFWDDDHIDPLVVAHKKVLGKYNFKFVMMDLYKKNYDKIHYDDCAALFFKKGTEYYSQSQFDAYDAALFLKRVKYFLRFADRKRFSVEYQCFLLSYKSKKDEMNAKAERKRIRDLRKEEKGWEVARKLKVKEEKLALKKAQFKEKELERIAKKDYGEGLTNSFFVL